MLSQYDITFDDVNLFDDTIYNNIRCGRPGATEMEILTAAEKAEVLDFALELREGVNTRIGKDGNKLSRREKQRISVARALLKEAPILFPDEQDQGWRISLR